MDLVQAGQFLGARSDFVPEETCAWLRKLSDEVPPMPASQVTALLRSELATDDLGCVFEWIDLERPLGSASIAQVHKAKLRQYQRRPSALQRAFMAPARFIVHVFSASPADARATWVMSLLSALSFATCFLIR